MDLFVEQIDALETLLGRMHNRISYEKRGSIPLVTALYSLKLLNTPLQRVYYRCIAFVVHHFEAFFN